MKSIRTGLWMSICLSWCLVTCLCLVYGTAHAEVTFEIIGEGYATAISADGSVIVGNTQGNYETFRWTEQTGIVPLGQASVPVLGVGAGAPDVSADGTRVSATILGADSTYVTQGRWTEGSGWQETMPPLPPGGGLMDNAYGSAWGISDDGETLVGLYWRPGQPGGSAHASAWTEATGVIDQGSSGGSCRANDANADGSVIVGWDENPAWGGWRPTVWVDGVLTTLGEYDAFCSASIVSPDGTLIAGQSYDAATQQRPASTWSWTGSVWEEEQLGTLPGTFPPFGLAIANDMTPDGSMIVGYNRFSSPWYATGFIWTQETGMIDVEDFLLDHGVILDPTFDIKSVAGVSDDGTILTGSGDDLVYPYTARSFIIRIDAAAAVATMELMPVLTRVRALPNPTRGATTLTLDLFQSDDVALEIYDSNGRSVRRLLVGPVLAGQHEVRWDGRDGTGNAVASGIYYCRFEAGAYQETQKLAIVR